MTTETIETVKQITTQVLDENAGLFAIDVMDLMMYPDRVYFKEAVEKVMIQYGAKYMDTIYEFSKIPYGLLLGLTKRFLEFSVKNLVRFYKYASDETVAKVYDIVTEQAIETTKGFINEDVIVYVMYRDLKLAIDKIFNK